jgi:Ca2+/Na+ antiporter
LEDIPLLYVRKTSCSTTTSEQSRVFSYRRLMVINLLVAALFVYVLTRRDGHLPVWDLLVVCLFLSTNIALFLKARRKLMNGGRED